MRDMVIKVKKWFKRHYRITSLLFLGVIFVGWMAFINAEESERILKQADSSAITPTEVPGITKTVGETVTTDLTATAAPTEAAEEPTKAEEPTAEPAVTAEPTPTLAPTATVAPTPTLAPTATPVPTATPTPEPTPTPVPVTNEARPFNYAVANVNDRLNIRSGAGDTYSIVGYLKANGYCEVLERGSEWTKVKSGNLTGYAFTTYLIFDDECIERLRQLNKMFVKINTGKVNIRSAANTDCDILTQATEGAKYAYIPEKSVENWYCIKYNDNQVGYISDSLAVIVIETEKAIPIS